MPQSTVIHFNKERRMQLVEHALRPLEHQHLGALNVDLDERNRSRRGSGDEIIDSDGGDGDPFGMKTDPMITRVQLVTPEANRPGFRSGGSLVQSDAILQTGFFYLCSEHLEVLAVGFDCDHSALFTDPKGEFHRKETNVCPDIDDRGARRDKFP